MKASKPRGFTGARGLPRNARGACTPAPETPPGRSRTRWGACCRPTTPAPSRDSGSHGCARGCPCPSGRTAGLLLLLALVGLVLLWYRSRRSGPGHERSDTSPSSLWTDEDLLPPAAGPLAGLGTDTEDVLPPPPPGEETEGQPETPQGQPEQQEGPSRGETDTAP